MRRDLLIARLGGGDVVAAQRADLRVEEGVSSLASSLMHSKGNRPRPVQSRGDPAAKNEISDRSPKLRDERYFANCDPHPTPDSGHGLDATHTTTLVALIPTQRHQNRIELDVSQWMRVWTGRGFSAQLLRQPPPTESLVR